MPFRFDVLPGLPWDANSPSQSVQQNARPNTIESVFDLELGRLWLIWCEAIDADITGLVVKAAEYNRSGDTWHWAGYRTASEQGQHEFRAQAMRTGEMLNSKRTRDPFASFPVSLK